MKYVKHNFSDHVFEISLNDLKFVDCDFSNAIFQDISINNVHFINCDIDIVINGCTVSDSYFYSKYLSQILNINSELDNVLLNGPFVMSKN